MYEAKPWIGGDAALHARRVNADRPVAEVEGPGPGPGAGAVRLPVLIIHHQKHSTPGRIGHRLREMGYRLDIRRPRFGDTLPATMRDHAGVVVFGGPMSANDGEGYLRREIDWLAVPLGEERPLLGVCLGAQMLALLLGADVRPHPDKLVEVGYHPLEGTAAGARIGAWPSAVYQWHREGFDLPAGARLLARGVRFENQAFAYGRAAFGVQFHPEITYAMVNRWTLANPGKLHLPGAAPRRAHFDGHFRHGAAVGAWLDGFLGVWIGAGVPVA